MPHEEQNPVVCAAALYYRGLLLGGVGLSLRADAVGAEETEQLRPPTQVSAYRRSSA
jgi:hypothetical protein